MNKLVEGEMNIEDQNIAIPNQQPEEEPRHPTIED